MTEELVYKYLSSDRIDVLEKRLIRFTQPRALNDPFETRPNLSEMRRYFEQRAEHYAKSFKLSVFDAAKTAILAKKQIKNRFEEWQAEQDHRYLFLSLSKNRNNLLMWAHYCQSHCGFVMGFDSNHTYFNTREPEAFSPLQQVNYSDNRPIVTPDEENWSELANMFLFTKSAHWAYEEELRMVASPRHAAQVEEDPRGNKVYLFEYPREIVKEIIFGLSLNENLQKRITEIVRSQYPEATIFRAQLNPEKFDLDIVQVF